MGVAGRNEDLQVFAVVQMDAHMLAEGGRLGVDVQRHVVDSALAGAHQLALGLAFLEVQAAQHPARRARVVVLHEVPAQRGEGVVALLAVALQQEAALVLEDVRMDDDYARQRCLFNSQGRAPGQRPP